MRIRKIFIRHSKSTKLERLLDISRDVLLGHSCHRANAIDRYKQCRRKKEPCMDTPIQAISCSFSSLFSFIAFTTSQWRNLTALADVCRLDELIDANVAREELDR